MGVKDGCGNAGNRRDGKPLCTEGGGAGRDTREKERGGAGGIAPVLI